MRAPCCRAWRRRRKRAHRPCTLRASVPPAELPGRVRGLLTAAAAAGAGVAPATGDIVRAVGALTRAASRQDLVTKLHEAGAPAMVLDVLAFGMARRAPDIVSAAIAALGVILVNVENVEAVQGAGIAAMTSIVADTEDPALTAATAHALWLAVESDRDCARCFVSENDGFGCLKRAMRAHAHSADVMWRLISVASGALGGIDDASETSSQDSSDAESSDGEEESETGAAARAFVAEFAENLIESFPRDSRIVEE